MNELENLYMNARRAREAKENDTAMGKKSAKEEFKDGFAGGAHARGIHSVGDFFRAVFKAVGGIFKIIFR